MNNINQELKAPEVLVLLLQNEKLCPFECLMKLCKPIVYSAIKDLYIEGYEVEDLLQEGRIVLTIVVDEYQFGKNLSFLRYYQMMLRNHIRKLIRKQEAQIRRANKNAYSLEKLSEEKGIHIKGLASTDTLPEDVTIVKESYNQYVCELSEFEKMVYTGYLAMKTVEEIAEELCCNVEQVQNALYRCKKKLNKILDHL